MGLSDLTALANSENAVVHASCIAAGGRGLLIVGRSGSGKSALALEMMGLGAELVADDRVELLAQGNRVLAQSPPAISGLIEARGIGLLRARAAEPAPLAFVLDLDETETKRLPEPREILLFRQNLPLLQAVKAPHFAASLMQLLRMGRVPLDWPNS